MKQAFPSVENYNVETRGHDISESSTATFRCLKHLEFCGHGKLESLCESSVTFPSLENMELKFCPKLKRLPFKMQSLPPKLHRLLVAGSSPQTTWNTLEWEEEGVKALLERVLTLQSR